MKKVGMHCYVSGRVQGVFFRASTKAKAQTLGVTGWVKNLPDGRVEVLAFGEEGNIAILQKWLHEGPAGAQVTDIDSRDAEWEEHDGFKTS